jgi:hypothetical protein
MDRDLQIQKGSNAAKLKQFCVDSNLQLLPSLLMIIAVQRIETVTVVSSTLQKANQNQLSHQNLSLRENLEKHHCNCYVDMNANHLMSLDVSSCKRKVRTMLL